MELNMKNIIKGIISEGQQQVKSRICHNPVIGLKKISHPYGS
jgi:hypothetical protein